MSQTLEFQHIDLSDRRRVLIAGDIHGMFNLLEEALDELDYDPDLDTLALLGDLVNRGEHSIQATTWATRTNVLRVRGNHEDMIRMIAEGDVNSEDASAIGAAWFYDLAAPERSMISAALNAAPAALELITPNGRAIGLTHADCPGDWAWLRSALSDPTHPQHHAMVKECLLSRKHGRKVVEGSRNGKPSTHRCHASGIDHIFHGHTVFTFPFSHDGRSWIDTGGYSRGRLTVIDADKWLDDIDERRMFQ